jgi:argininosuccinate lyase
MKKELYRSRIKKALDKNVLEFLSSLKEDLWIAEEDIIGTEVHDIMLYEQNILKRDEIKKILRSLERIRKNIKAGKIRLTGDFEDIHPFIESYVIDEIGIDIGGKIHTGRSRNDQVSVDLRLKIRKQLNEISLKLFNFIDIILDLSQKNLNTYMPLYTHLQKAQLGLFSHYLNYYCSQILRIEERIGEIYKRINKNPLGSCAIGGTNINIDRKRTMELLGFDGLIENTIDAVSSRDYIIETMMLLSLLAIHISRISEDLMIWSTKEFDFIELDDEYCSVSSVMPQKRNPDSLEIIRAKSSNVVSNLSTANLIIKAIPSGYFRDFQQLKPLLKDSFNLMQSILVIITGIFSTIKINKENMLEQVKDSYICALDLAELLVEDYGIPFRKAHQIVATLVKNSKTPDDLFNQEKINEMIRKHSKKDINISNNEIKLLKNVEKTLEKRISQGSSSRKEISSYFSSLKESKEKLYNSYLLRIKSIKKADSKRINLLNKLID